MAITINFAGASFRKPGAYSRIKVAPGGAAQAQLGVMAIIGESDEGSAFAAESGLSSVVYGPDNYNSIRDKFGTGPLVDAARVALSPSNDPQISGGAQQLYVLKTNQSVKASRVLATSYGTLTALSAGEKGNNISSQVDNSAGKRIITISDAVRGVSEVSSAIGGKVVFTLLATEVAITVATVTITATKLTTTLTGAVTTSPLNITLANFTTIEQLVDYINAVGGYTAVITNADQKSAKPSVMDKHVAGDIKTSAFSILRNVQDVKDFFAGSALISFAPTATIGLPIVAPRAFLSGGALGATSNSNIQDCIDALLKARINFVVPLFSRDASSDITDGLTDAASAYTIDSIHASIRSHVAQASTVRGKKERQAWVGFKGSYVNAKDKSANLGSARVSLCFQNADIVDSLGSLVTAQPHMLAVAAAGMHASAVVGLPTTFKLVNINGFSMDGNDFDPEVDSEDALEANLTFVEKAPGGIRFVLDNSTYALIDNAWIYNRPAVMYAADTAAFAIRLNTETFVGKRNSDITPETIKNLLISVMDGLRASGIIVPDAASGGKGFKDLTVKFEGSVIKTGVTLILVEGFEFVLNEITVQRATA